MDKSNLIQASTSKIDRAGLKKKFGNDLVLWNAVEEQKMLSKGNPDEVRIIVKNPIHDLASGSGYVIVPHYNIQADVTLEN